MYLIGYECTSGAGLGADRLWKQLSEGHRSTYTVKGDEFNATVPAGASVCFIPGQDLKNRNYQETFRRLLKETYNRIEEKFDLDQKKVLCILSSTKGSIEDHIDSASSVTDFDPLLELASDIPKALNTKNSDYLVVSNACSSSHVAIELAKTFLDAKSYDYVVVVAFDLVGPFVYSGFFNLKVSSLTQNRPFSTERDGLQLGEALAIMIFSHQKSHAKFKINSVASLVETSSITKPSMDGSCLKKVIEKLKPLSTPDFIVTHGTGTKFNDLSEDLALGYFDAPITSCKWSLGHTLGASGAIDLIAACEILKYQRLFRINSTPKKDPSFKGSYITQDSQMVLDQKLNTSLITSLGFGGVHAALVLEKFHD